MLAMRMIDTVYKTISHPKNVEILLYLNDDDPTLNDYKKYIDSLDAWKGYRNMYEQLAIVELKQLAGMPVKLDTLLAKASRPDADPQQIMAKALKDPATMRVLVEQLCKNPDDLAALRETGAGAKPPLAYNCRPVKRLT